MRHINRRPVSTSLAFVAILIWAGAVCAQTQTTSFTYQGRLTDGGTAANGNYDLQFALWDSAAGGAQIGATQTVANVSVSAGNFTVTLDFGVNAFPGANRFLEIAVRPMGGGAFTTLSPRQQISSTPYAIRTLSATASDSLSNACVGCVQDSQINQVAGSKVNGTIPVASVPAGSANYIQNTTTSQPGVNFNIGGSGTAGSLNVNGSSTFGGIAPPAPAPAGQGRIYFDAAASKLRVSENGAAFVDLVGSSGVSGSGTSNTLPLWSGSTLLGNSAIAQSGNNVGIGTNSPISKFHIVSGLSDTLPPRLQSAGTNTFAAGVDFYHGSTAKGYVGVPDAGAGVGPGEMLLFGVGRTSLWAGSVRSVTLDTTGNVGIGALAPSFKLDVSGNLRAVGLSSNDILVETAGGTNAWARLNLKSPNQHWTLGTSQNFNGDQFYLYDFTNSQFRMTVQPGAGGAISFPTGNVGIGTTTPTAAKLVVNDTSIGTAVDGTSATGSGVFGESTSATGSGVYGRNNAGGYAIYAEGNAGQALNKGGWVKAMAFVEADGTLVRCYNGITGDSTVPCGISASQSAPGTYIVTFPFTVSDRFITVTPKGISFNICPKCRMGIDVRPFFDPDTLLVQTFNTQDASLTDIGFWIFIF